MQHYELAGVIDNVTAPKSTSSQRSPPISVQVRVLLDHPERPEALHYRRWYELLTDGAHRGGQGSAGVFLTQFSRSPVAIRGTQTGVYAIDLQAPADCANAWPISMPSCGRQRQLRLQGTWEKSDGPLLEAYCANVVKAREARAKAEQYKHSSSIELGATLKIIANAEAAALAIAESLLLTPESRQRNGIKSPGKVVEDELQALIG